MSALNSPPFFTALKSPLKTRSEIQEACVSLLNPVVPFFSPDKTRVRLGATATRYDETGAQLEGFTRPLWGLASLLAGGYSYPDATIWLEGLRNGTDPEHPEFWGFAQDLDQRMVEMCPLGYALCVAPKQFWDPLSEKERKNVERWLGWINQKQMPNTNWLWFRVFANLALMRNGANYSAERLELDLDHLDTFYRGDGWSNDGPEGYTQMDYYSGSFAIQFLQLLYVKINGNKDTKRAEKYSKRARLFAKDFVHYFDEEGRAITFGRSLTYRFAMAGFWSAVALSEVQLDPTLGPGMIKGLLLRNLRWWSKQNDILTLQGTLSIGYTYPNQFMSENYNSSGSTYWFMLGFVALALPESHTFWQCKEEPYPAKSVPRLMALKQPKHIITHAKGYNLLLSSGQRCHYPMRAAESKYGKFAYSSAFGYSVPTGNHIFQATGADSMLSVSDDNGETWKARRVVIDEEIKEYNGLPVLVSGWKPWSNVLVKTFLVPPTDNAPNWHIRAHYISTKRSLKTCEAAFSISGVREKDGRELPKHCLESTEGRHQQAGEAFAVSQAGVSGIVELRTQEIRTGQVFDEDANSNIVESRTALPVLTADIPSDSDIWFVTAVFAVPSILQGWQKIWGTEWTSRPMLPEWLKETIK